VTGLLSAWIAEMVLIAYRGAKNGTTATNPIPHLSLPSEYASTFIIFGGLAFIPGEGQKVATAFGWGIVIATLMNLWNPPGTNLGTTTGAAASTAPAQSKSTPNLGTSNSKLGTTSTGTYGVTGGGPNLGIGPSGLGT
jgi:hypothetical protein